jgi:hypothetical protein
MAGLLIYYILPFNTDLTVGSETSAKLNLTPGKYPQEKIQITGINYFKSLNVLWILLLLLLLLLLLSMALQPSAGYGLLVHEVS